MEMNHGQKIVGALMLLAEQSGEKVSEERLKFMTSKLVELPAAAVVAALEKLLETARRFPTVAEVKDAMGLKAATPDDQAREIADRIWGAIERFGSWNLAKVEEHLGEIAWAVVTLNGGWPAICNMATYDAAPTLRAQWRESAAAMIRKEASGTPRELPPAFPPTQLPERAQKALSVALAATSVVKDTQQ